MNTKHTPGPWKFGELSECILSPEGHIVADISESVLDNTLANARLIAAAPDLLAALKELIPIASAMNAETGSWNKQIAAARAAIAKCKG